jgi:hypothetical protein
MGRKRWYNFLSTVHIDPSLFKHMEKRREEKRRTGYGLVRSGL